MIALVILGAILMFIGAIGILINAFKESMLWGLGSLLLSPVMLVYVILHWQDNKNAFFLQLAGLALIFLAAMMAPGAAPPVAGTPLG